MRKMSKFVKIFMTTILTLSMILGSYMGVFAVPAANGIGKYVTEVVQEEEWGYVQDDHGLYIKYNNPLRYEYNPIWAWTFKDNRRFDYVKVQDEVTRQVWKAGSIVIDPTSDSMDINETSTVSVTISNSDYDFDNGTYGWTSSDESVVRINSTTKTSNGKITTAHIKALAPGTSTLTLTATVNGVQYTKTCVITVYAYIEHVDVNKTGTISYVAQETYNGVVTQAPAQLTNAKISNVSISLQGYDQWVYNYTDQFRAYTNHWNDFEMSTQANFDGNVSIVISYKIKGTAANGDSISQNVVDTVSFAEAMTAFNACPGKNGLDFSYLYNYLVNTNYYDVTFSDKGTDTLVSKVVENGNVLSSQIPAASTYEETAIDGTKTVHTFEGWLLNNTGDALSDAEVAALAITGNTTFVASYSDVNYNTVLFNDGNGSAIGSVVEVEQGTTVASVPATAIKSDKIENGVKTTYVFNGNWEDEDGSVYTSEEVAALSIIENKTFTALFDETNHFTVIFEDEASNELGRVEYVTDGNAVDASLIPVVADTDVSDGSGTRTTTEFEGWLDSDTSLPVDLSTETISSNRTFVADVTVTNFFTIELYDADGNPLTTIEVKEGEDVTIIPDAPLKADEVRADGKYYFTFDKWILMLDLEAITFEDSSTAPVVLDSIFTGVNGPMKIMPIYTENKYLEVKFYVQLTDGTKVLASTQYVKPGEDAVDPAAELMKANGYTLGAWNGSITGVEKDTDVTARVANVAGAVETNTRQPVIAGATEVATGDNTPIVSMSVLLMAAAFSIVFITNKRRKDA